IDSTHRIVAGANFLQEFGDQKFLKDLSPILYYQYVNSKWNFYVGSFPRQNLLDDYPRALLNDTLNYFRPTVEGILAKYEYKGLRQTLWIDWTGKQTKVDREKFLFGISGKYQPS